MLKHRSNSVLNSGPWLVHPLHLQMRKLGDKHERARPYGHVKIWTNPCFAGTLAANILFRRLGSGKTHPN